MFKNNLKIAFRNLWKNKGYTIISIGGLSIALCCFILALLYVNYEWSYDKAFKDGAQIYRIEIKDLEQGGGRTSSIASPLADIFRQKIPEIEQMTKVLTTGDQVLLKSGTQKSLYIENVYYSDSSFFQIFNYPFVYGNPRQALAAPNDIVLSLATATKLFGNEDPVGRLITVDNQKQLTVTGVFDDRAFPSHFNMDAIQPFRTISGIDLWRANYVHTYLKLNPNSNISSLENKLTKINREESAARNKTYHYPEDVKTKLSRSLQEKIAVLLPVKDIHLNSKDSDEITPGGSNTAIWMIVGLASLMLLIAAINFSNLAIARAPSRAKEIGLRKVLGSSRSLVVRQFLMEIILQCIIALMAALILVELFSPAFSHLMHVPLSMREYAPVGLWLQISLLIIMVILIAGLYPSIHLSSFQPAKVLKGNMATSTSGKTIFQSLMLMQFIITAVFIAGLFIMNRQVHYMKNKDLGFSSSQVLVLHINDWNNQYRIPFIQSELKKITGVADVAKTSVAGPPDGRTQMNIKINGQSFDAQYLCVGTDFFNVMNAHIASGRNFLANDTLKGIIINKTLAETAGISDIGQIQTSGSNHIVGIVNDLNFYGFENRVAPMAFFAFDFTSTPYLLVKLKTHDISRSIAAIESLWKTIEPGFPLQYQFLDQNFEMLYINYERLGKIFAIFTVLALLIALMGLSALAAFTAERRTREIAVRKILGASVNDILKLLNKRFVILVVAANIIAIPLTYHLAQKWLNEFAYRIDIPVMPFVLAGVMSIILTVVIVSLQVIRAARANPVNALKYE